MKFLGFPRDSRGIPWGFLGIPYGFFWDSMLIPHGSYSARRGAGCSEPVFNLPLQQCQGRGAQDLREEFGRSWNEVVLSSRVLAIGEASKKYQKGTGRVLASGVSTSACDKNHLSLIDSLTGDTTLPSLTPTNRFWSC